MYWLMKVIAVLIVLGSILFIGFHVFQQTRTEYIKEEKLEAIKLGKEQLYELKNLGFSDHDNRVKLVKKRIAFATDDLEKLGNNINIISLARSHQMSRKEKLKQVYIMTKSMIATYRHELETLNHKKL